MMQGKIAIVGPESSGKSSLSLALAKYYQCEWVPEYARKFLDQLDRPYVEDDLLDIAVGQMLVEAESFQDQDLIICDTNLLVIRVWGIFKFGRSHPFINDEMDLSSYSFHLLTYPDLPWEYDPQREHPNDLIPLFNLYKEELDHAGLSYGIVRGQGEERLSRALNLLNS